MHLLPRPIFVEATGRQMQACLRCVVSRMPRTADSVMGSTFEARVLAITLSPTWTQGQARSAATVLVLRDPEFVSGCTPTLKIPPQNQTAFDHHWPRKAAPEWVSPKPLHHCRNSPLNWRLRQRAQCKSPPPHPTGFAPPPCAPWYSVYGQYQATAHRVQP